MEPLLTVRQASATYPVWAGRGLLEKVGSLVTPRGRVFVVAPAALAGSYGQTVASSFHPEADLLVMPEGEANKTLETAASLVTSLLERHAGRDAMIVAAGGGMVGDTAGFAAAIFMRGVDLVQVPTTLLAQVDSSIGGKVAVNHPLGKNLIGAFHPPRAVIVDPAVLDTLDRRQLVSGLFEALKGGVVGDPMLFEIFASSGLPDGDALEEIIRRKIAVKAAIVSADERESGVRRLLNYGHTIGHAIEAALSYQGLTHGEAVGWGMLAANSIAVRRGLLAPAEAERINGAVRALGLPPLPPMQHQDVLAAAGHDKKNQRGARVMVLPRQVGECIIAVDVTPDEVAFGVDSLLS